MKIVIDSSVFIDYARSKKGIYLELLSQASRGAPLYVPSIVLVELWAGTSMGKANKTKEVERLLGGMTIQPLTKQLAQKAGELVRQKRVVEVADAVIAATALFLDAQVATRNTKHFQKIKGLKLFQPS